MLSFICLCLCVQVCWFIKIERRKIYVEVNDNRDRLTDIDSIFMIPLMLSAESKSNFGHDDKFYIIFLTF